MADEFDVVVVGGGGAGLAAAIESAESGRSVLLLEKNPSLGGSTAWSIGSVTSSGTPHQRAEGVRDDPESHFHDMALFNGALDPRDNPQLRRILCDEIPSAFEWLLESGVRFFGPMPEPPHTQPRMHNVLPNSKSFIYHLLKRAKRAGVTVKVGATVDGLMLEEGKVVGVNVRAGNEARTCKARMGVILAAGDFTAGTDLKASYMGPREAGVEAVNMTATGDGQKMALTLGARIINGDVALGPELRFIAPPKAKLVQRMPPWSPLAQAMAWALKHVPDAILRPFIMNFVTTALAPSLSLFEQGAVLVNSGGELVGKDCASLAYDLAAQDDKRGYILLDAHTARQFETWPHFISTAPGIAYAYLADYRRNRRDIYVSATSSAELAAKLGMKAKTLQDAIGHANQDRLEKFEEGTIVALGPVRPVFVHAEGGLAVNDRLQVLGADDRAISGLYAAGSTGQGGLLLKGHGHHLAWAFVSGRRAARMVAQDVAHR